MRVGIIGGSGLGEALLEQIVPSDIERHDMQTPFGRPSATIITGQFGRTPIALLPRHGEGHTINPGQLPSRANIFALKQLGCTHIVASGACGSLREHIEPGSIVICDQLIDRTHSRPRTFFEQAAVHVEFADPCCAVMRRWLCEAAQTLEYAAVHDRGTYVCMEGPRFSTRAESQMHRQWGADVVGMTACPEAQLAREAEMAYALVALPTDYDCWRPRDSEMDQQSLIQEIIGNLSRAMEASVQLLRAALNDVSVLEQTPSAAHDALKLAIWSDKSRIDAKEVQRLGPLWGRYFA